MFCLKILKKSPGRSKLATEKGHKLPHLGHASFLRGERVKGKGGPFWILGRGGVGKEKKQPGKIWALKENMTLEVWTIQTPRSITKRQRAYVKETVFAHYLL